MPHNSRPIHGNYAGPLYRKCVARRARHPEDPVEDADPGRVIPDVDQIDRFPAATVELVPHRGELAVGLVLGGTKVTLL